METSRPHFRSITDQTDRAVEFSYEGRFRTLTALSVPVGGLGSLFECQWMKLDQSLRHLLPNDPASSLRPGDQHHRSRVDLANATSDLGAPLGFGVLIYVRVKAVYKRAGQSCSCGWG
jgi:hypothetical protein